MLQDVYKTAEAIRAAGGTITKEPGPLPGLVSTCVETLPHPSAMQALSTGVGRSLCAGSPLVSVSMVTTPSLLSTCSDMLFLDQGPVAHPCSTLPLRYRILGLPRWARPCEAFKELHNPHTPCLKLTQD